MLPGGVGTGSGEESPARSFDHLGVLPGQCRTCHTGQLATGLAIARQLRAHWNCGLVIVTGRGDAVDKIVHHLTSGEKAKFPDGHEEDHKIVKSQDPAAIKNLVDWILALPGGTKY